MYFPYFLIISPRKWAGTFNWTNLNSHYPRMLCAKFGWNWLIDSWKHDFKVCQSIFPISLLSPHGKGCGPWINLNPHHSRMLFAKFGWNWPKWFLKRRFLKFFNIFSLFPHYLPLEKGVALHLNKLNSPGFTSSENFRNSRCSAHGRKYNYFCPINCFKCSYSKIYT